MFRTAVLSLSLLFAASAAIRAEMASFTQPQDLVDLPPEARLEKLEEYVDRSIRMLSGEEALDMFVVQAAAIWIETRTATAEWDGELNEKPRERIARDLLEKERNEALEKACLAALESGDENLRATARQILAQSMGSRVREEAWAREVREASEECKRTGILPVSRDELFSLAENLAYLGNPAGKDVLQDIILAPDGPSSLLQHRAIRAMKALGELRPDGVLGELLLSPDAKIACEAFIAVGGGRNGSWATPFVMGAAQIQLERLWQKYDREGSLSLDEAHLLSTAGFVLFKASRERALVDGLAASAKAAARHFVECDDRTLQEQAALLFGELAGEEDE